MSANSYFFEDLSLGMTSTYVRTVEAADIQAFADISGDDKDRKSVV